MGACSQLDFIVQRLLAAHRNKPEFGTEHLFGFRIFPPLKLARLICEALLERATQENRTPDLLFTRELLYRLS